MSVNTAFLLDSSVVVKWFKDETDSDKALAVQSEFLAGKLDIQISDLTFYETANALRYSGEYSPGQIRACLNSIVALGVTAHDFRLEVLESAVELSFNTGISIYDAYLVSLARTYGTTLITADERLCARVQGEASVALLRYWEEGQL